MSNGNLAIAISVIAVIIVGMFLFAYYKSTQIAPSENPNENIPDQKAPSGPYDFIERIDAKHFYIDGTHTLVGEMLMPTPCDLLEWKVQIAESFPEQVAVNFTVINTADACAQVVTPQRFKVSFDASKDAVIHAMLEGKSVNLNLIPAAEGETPGEFELFIKG